MRIESNHSLLFVKQICKGRFVMICVKEVCFDWIETEFEASSTVRGSALTADAPAAKGVSSDPALRTLVINLTNGMIKTNFISIYIAF